MAYKIDRDTMIQLATMYYLGDISQDKLAVMMGLSRTKVSRLLKQCREQKIVEFKINYGSDMLSRMEQTLAEYLGIPKVFIVPSAATTDGSRRNVGAKAAEYLASIIKNNMEVGIAWGSTIREMVDCLKTQHLADSVEIIQLSGGVNLSSTDCNERELAKMMAMKLGARCRVFQAPILVQNPLLRSLFLKEPDIAEHFGAFSRLDVAFLGLGSSDPYETMMYKAGYLSLDETRQLIDMGAIGDLCGHRISLDGKPVHTFLDERIIAIGLEQLKKVPLKVALAAGCNKADSIIAACRGHYIDTVITDEIAAMTIQRRLSAEAAG